MSVRGKKEFEVRKIDRNKRISDIGGEEGQVNPEPGGGGGPEVKGMLVEGEEEGGRYPSRGKERTQNVFTTL